MKRIKTLVLATIMFFVAAVALPMEVRANDDYTIIFAEVPSDWEAPHVWAWGPRGDAFPSWPGGEMTPDSANPGWYFIYIPSDKTGALISANGGSIQTSDFPFDGSPVWVTVNSADDFSATNEQQTTGAFPEFVPFVAPVAEGSVVIDAVVVFAYVPEGWEAPGVWAWGPRGNAFDEWPGGSMTPDTNNPGWYYVFLPADKTGALINANDGSVQTSDFAFEGVPVWVTVSVDDEEVSFEVTNEQQTEGAIPTSDPFVFGAEPEPSDIPDMGQITLRAYIPESWIEPGVWAWNDADGFGDVFSGWPGEQFASRDGTWHVMQLPAWTDHIIINAISGGVQTVDIEVLQGEDIWIVILDTDGAFYLSHTEIDPDDEHEAAPPPERAPPVAIAAELPAETPAPTPEPVEDESSNTVLIIIIVVAAVVVIGGVILVILKKKK